MKRTAIILALTCACAADVRIQVEPAWPEDRSGVMIALALDGSAIGKPIPIHGRALSLTWFETDQPFRLWVETYGPDSTPRLFDPDCTLDLAGGPEEELAAGDRYQSGILDAREPRATRFESTVEERPIGIFLHCPPLPTLCSLVRTTESKPTTGGADLTAVYALPTGELLIGGVEEDTGLAFYGRIEPDGSLTRFDLQQRRGKVRSLAFEGERGWASTNAETMIALDSSGAPTPAVPDRVGRVVTFSAGLGLNALDRLGRVLHYSATATVGTLVGDRTDLVTLVAGPDRLYAHNDVSFEEYDDAWHRGGPPDGSAVNQAGIAVRGSKVAIFGPKGIWVRNDPSAEWMPVPAPRQMLGGAFWGEDRLIGLSDLHTLDLWDGQRWCIITLSNSSRLTAITVTADERQAIIVGSNYDDAGDPLVIQLE